MKTDCALGKRNAFSPNLKFDVTKMRFSVTVGPIVAEIVEI